MRTHSYIVILPLLLAALTVVCCVKKIPPLHKFQILASTVWTRTNLMIPDKSMIRIEAIGAISPNGHTYVDANGSRDEDWNRYYNLYRGINHCALIARIGPGGEVRFVGVSQIIKVLNGGELLLGINDKDPDNNKGTLDVSVEILN